MSKVIFVCPNTATIVKRLVHSSYVDPQYENLWLVRKQSYERCVINTTTDTRLWLCDEPLKLKYYTVTFKRFSASKEPEFQPGKDYYFIGRSHHFKLYDELNYVFWLVPVMTYLWPIRGEYIDDVTITSLCFFVVLNYRFHFAMSLFRSNRAQKNEIYSLIQQKSINLLWWRHRNRKLNSLTFPRQLCLTLSRWKRNTSSK